MTLFAVDNLPLHFLIANLPWSFGAERITIIDHPEGSILERRVIGGVVAVLSPRKPLEPLARTISGEASRYRSFTQFNASDWPSD